MDDLRDSGEIGEKANVVLMLHNPTPREERQDGRVSEPIELHIEKNTDGPLGMVPLLHMRGRFLLGEPTDNYLAQAREAEPAHHWQEEKEMPF